MNKAILAKALLAAKNKEQGDAPVVVKKKAFVKKKGKKVAVGKKKTAKKVSKPFYEKAEMR